MEPRGDIGGRPPEAVHAGRVGRDRSPYGELAESADGPPMFLTALRQDFPRPERISGDHELRRTAHDDPYQQVIYHDTLLTVGGVPVWLLTVGGGLLVRPYGRAHGRKDEATPPRREVVLGAPGYPAPAQDNWPS
ncbi:hypothetical protein ABZS86_01430 [Streptomyces sp. NPDC005355]|uniref:hypothetical protein n=1 Tax=Streptomyces sp. NPDC005355 TaxID=3157038 RepID=UPI0033AEF0C0